jgi:dGTPase
LATGLDTSWRSRRPFEPRAAYAAPYAASFGRLIPEPESLTRSPFQRDRDRIIHAAAFRRLAHKTQVFVPHEGDHYRTRLTHSIEVGQLARALARSLGLDEDLAEAIGLAHDLGHTPFGHTGEEVLDALMRDCGGFDHNAQTLRVVTKLERRYAAFDGLNLSYETIEGLAKHNGPLDPTGLPAVFIELDAAFAARGRPLDLHSFATAEAQCAALADDIAYDAHDLDDGLRAGLFALSDCSEVPLLAELLDIIRALYPMLDQSRCIHEVTRRVITHFVEDAIGESLRRLSDRRDVEAIRGAGRPVVAFSDATARQETELKAFLWRRMYRHPDIVHVREGAAAVVGDLYRRFQAEPDLMPAEWRPRGDDPQGRAERLVGDYIAGMTDRYALSEHRRLFPTTPELRYRKRG